MTSHLKSHRTTDIKPEMLSGVQTGNGTPHDKYNIRGIAHARTNRKDDIFMQRRLVQNFTSILEWGKGLVYWRSTHGAGHIPGIFSLHAAYSALRHFLYTNTSRSIAVQKFIFKSKRFQFWSFTLWSLSPSPLLVVSHLLFLLSLFFFVLVIVISINSVSVISHIYMKYL